MSHNSRRLVTLLMLALSAVTLALLVAWIVGVWVWAIPSEKKCLDQPESYSSYENGDNKECATGFLAILYAAFCTLLTLPLVLATLVEIVAVVRAAMRDWDAAGAAHTVLLVRGSMLAACAVFVVLTALIALFNFGGVAWMLLSAVQLIVAVSVKYSMPPQSGGPLDDDIEHRPFFAPA